MAGAIATGTFGIGSVTECESNLALRRNRSAVKGETEKPAGTELWRIKLGLLVLETLVGTTKRDGGVPTTWYWPRGDVE